MIYDFFRFTIIQSRIAAELKTVQGNPHKRHWSMKMGYTPNVDENEVYPHRVFDAGFQYALETLTGILLDRSYQFCRYFAPGFLLSLHMPNELPRFSHQFIYVPYEEDFYISVIPKVIRTSGDVRAYSPQIRGCYFRSERKLRFFKAYSQQMCELECVANFTLEMCNCVRFFMPRDANTSVCRFMNISCSFKAEREYTKRLISEQCACLPDCMSVTYNVETSQIKLYHSEIGDELKEKYIKTR